MSVAKKQRVCVLLSGNGTTLAAILAYQKRCPDNFAVTHVVSDNADAFGLKRAQTSGIATRVVPYKKFLSRSAFDEQLLDSVSACEPDLVVLAGFMRIVDESFVARFYNRLVNIHPSLLPKYPGLNTYQRALDAGEPHHGSSVHFVNNVLDGGPIIAQAVVPIEKDDDIATLSARVQEAERMLYPVVIEWFCAGRLQLENGKAKLDGEVLETPRIFHHDIKRGELYFEDARTSIR